jgi:hypothetical protein
VIGVPADPVVAPVPPDARGVLVLLLQAAIDIAEAAKTAPTRSLPDRNALPLIQMSPSISMLPATPG